MPFLSHYSVTSGKSTKLTNFILDRISFRVQNGNTIYRTQKCHSNRENQRTMLYADLFQNFTKYMAHCALTIGTVKVLKNHTWNEITTFCTQKYKQSMQFTSHKIWNFLEHTEWQMKLFCAMRLLFFVNFGATYQSGRLSI